MTRPARAALEAWARERDRRPDLPLDKGTLLFKDRRLTSLDLPELLLLLEELTESTLAIEDVTPEAFASLEALERRFL